MFEASRFSICASSMLLDLKTHGWANKKSSLRWFSHRSNSLLSRKIRIAANEKGSLKSSPESPWGSLGNLHRINWPDSVATEVAAPADASRQHLRQPERPALLSPVLHLLQLVELRLEQLQQSESSSSGLLSA